MLLIEKLKIPIHQIVGRELMPNLPVYDRVEDYGYLQQWSVKNFPRRYLEDILEHSITLKWEKLMFLVTITLSQHSKETGQNGAQSHSLVRQQRMLCGRDRYGPLS